MNTLPINNTKHPHFPNLDGLRFFAFFVVFLAHSFYTTDLNLKNNFFFEYIKPLLNRGILGVNFFFVLSGFLITYLLYYETKITNTINFKNFYIRRVLRIWPLYFIIIFIGFCLVPYFKQHFLHEPFVEKANLFYYLFFINNYDNTPSSAILGILWSIAIEEQFYLIWPVSIKKIPIKYHISFFLAIILISLCHRLYYLNNIISIYQSSLSGFMDLAIGGLAANLAFYNSDFVKKVVSIKQYKIFLIYLFSLIFILSFHGWKQFPILLYIEKIVESCFFAFVILEQNFSDTSFFKMSNLKYPTRLGKITYGLYMYQFVSILLVGVFFKKMIVDQSIAGLTIEALCALFCLILMAHLSYIFLESRIISLKDKFIFT